MSSKVLSSSSPNNNNNNKSSSSASSIVVDFIHSFITAPSPAHAYRHMQLFKVLLPTFFEHCGHEKETINDADWSALIEFLLMIAEQPVKDDEEEKKGEFKGTLLSLRYRRLSALDAMSCLSDIITKPHRSRCRVYTIIHGQVAERISHALDFQHHHLTKQQEQFDQQQQQDALLLLANSSTTSKHHHGSSNALLAMKSSVTGQSMIMMNQSQTTRNQNPSNSYLGRPLSAAEKLGSLRLQFESDDNNDQQQMQQSSTSSHHQHHVDDDVFGEKVTIIEQHQQDEQHSTRRSSGASTANQNQNSSNNNNNHQKTSTSNNNNRGDQTLAEVTNCETLTEDMAFIASSSNSIPVTMGLNGSLDLWYFSLDSVPAKMLGSLTESEFVAIETWFNSLAKDTGGGLLGGGGGAVSSSTGGDSGDSNGANGSGVSSQKALVTDGLIKGIAGQSSPLTVANVKSLAPRVYEVNGLWKFDCRLLDEWLNFFPRGSGTLADVIAFLYRDTPRQFIIRRIEGQCLSVPANHSEAWPADAFCCGQLIVPLQSFPPANSPPALRLSHISTSVSSISSSASALSSSSPLPPTTTSTNPSSPSSSPSSSILVEPDSNNNPFGGGGAGIHKIPDAHLATLSVITFLRIGVTASNRKEFLTALKAWFDAIDFASLGYITLSSLQTTMMRFREPSTSPILVERRVSIEDSDVTVLTNDKHEQQEQLTSFSAFSNSPSSGDKQQQDTNNNSSHPTFIEEDSTAVFNSNNENKVITTNNSSSIFLLQQQQQDDDQQQHQQTEQVYEKNPYLEKASFDECIEKAQELSKKNNNSSSSSSSTTTNNNNKNDNNTSSSSSFFLSSLASLCDVDLKEVFQFAVCEVAKKLQLESFTASSPSSSDQNSSNANINNNNNNNNNGKSDVVVAATSISASLQVLSSETLHAFKPPAGAIITANKRGLLLSSNNNGGGSPHQFSMAAQHALNATEAFVSQNAENHRPITFEVFARAFVEVAGLNDNSNNSGSNINNNNTNNSSNKNANNNTSSSSLSSKSLLIIHPAIIAEVSNVSTLRTMRRRNYKHSSDDRFNTLVAQYLAQAAPTDAKAGGKGGRGGVGSSKLSGTRSVGSRGTPKKKTGANSKDANAGNATSMSHLFLNGPVSFTISNDQRQRLRKRVDTCLHSFEAIGFLLVVTNVRAHFRIQRRLQQLAAMDDASAADPSHQQHGSVGGENLPLGKQRRSFSANNNKQHSAHQRRKSSAAAANNNKRRASSAAMISASSNSSSSFLNNNGFFDNEMNPLYAYLSDDEKLILEQLSNEASLLSSPSCSENNNKNYAITMLKKILRERLKPIPLMKLDRLFDPTNATDSMLLHLDGSGIPVDYFVNEPHGVYRRLPSQLLSGKARVYRDIGYWSSSKRRIAFRSKVPSSLSSSRLDAEQTEKETEEKRDHHNQRKREFIGETVLMRTSIPAGCDIAYRFHIEGFNGENNEAINTIVCGREGRKGNALISGEDHVTCDVDEDRTSSISVNNLSKGIQKVTAKLVRMGGSSGRKSSSSLDSSSGKEYLALEIHSPTETWSTAGFSVSLAVVSESYGAGFLCGVSFEVEGYY